MDSQQFISLLKSIAKACSAELLRIYWYDGAKGNMTVEQTVLAEMADVKVRLGYINVAGQQKGVDSLIVTDLIELARNQAICDAFLVSGDGDMRVAVQIAQSFGVRTHLVTLEPSNSSLNPQLRQEADTLREISKAEVRTFLSVLPPPSAVISTPPPTTAGHPALSIEQASNQSLIRVFASVPPSEIAKLKAVQTGKLIPAEYDRKILGTTRALLGRDLTNEERSIMRKIALDWLKQP